MLSRLPSESISKRPDFEYHLLGALTPHPVVFCSNKYSDFSADRITAGYTGQWPESILTSLGEALDKEVVPVPYKNSGETVLGFQAGNVDYVALASSRLTKLP